MAFFIFTSFVKDPSCGYFHLGRRSERRSSRLVNCKFYHQTWQKHLHKHMHIFICNKFLGHYFTNNTQVKCKAKLV